MKRMHVLLPLFAACIFVASFDARAEDVHDQLPPSPKAKTWKLIWNDEFNEDKLDESKWRYRPDGKRKGGWWSRDAVTLDGKGHLVISTFKDGDKYTDGCVITQGKFEHAFGYYLARIKFQEQPGHWTGTISVWSPTRHTTYRLLRRLPAFGLPVTKSSEGHFTQHIGSVRR